MSLPSSRWCSSEHLESRKEELLSTGLLNEQILQTFRCLQNFRQKGQFTDVVLCVGEEELPCHKVVLAASSPYFHAMFSSPYKEERTSHVQLDHVSPWALRRLLDFVYLGALELSVTTVQDVFSAASLLDYPVARKACVRFMEQHLDITNCLGVEALAELHGLSGLAKVARKLAVENFRTLLMESNEWVSLPLSTVITYISSDDLDVPSEEFVWDACMTWIDHDPESRVVHLPTLLSHIRLPLLDRNFLSTQLEQNAFIQECRSAQDLLQKCVTPDFDHISLPDHADWDLSPRPATLKRPTLVVLGGLNSCILNCMQSFSPSKTAWLPCPSMPVDSLVWFSVAVVSNVLYVMGGIKAGTIMSTVYSYSPLRGRWTQLCSMPQGRARHASVPVGSAYVYVFGGLTITRHDASDRHPAEFEEVEGAIQGSLIHSVPGVPVRPVSENEVPVMTISDVIIRYDICGDRWTTVGRNSEPRLESHVLVVDDCSSVCTSPRHRSGPCDDAGDLQQRFEISEAALDASNDNSSTNSLQSLREGTQRRRHIHRDRTIVEIGGITEAQPHGTDKVSFYCLHGDLTVYPTGDYIKLPQQMRYVNCSIHPTTHLIYLFWENTSELSVLDLTRHTLRPLTPLAPNPNLDQTRIHSGLTWVDGKLYVVGGFSQFSGDDRRPVLPRDDVHCFDPETNSWSVIRISNTTVPRAIFGCVCLNM